MAERGSLGAVDSDPADLTGAVLNQKHRLVKRIGWGGMGTVYATDSFEGGQRLAVKLLHADAMHEVDVVSRFLDEGRMCQKLVHPNIVRVYEVEVAEDGCPYIVMEFLSGVPLAAYTTQGGRVPLAQSITVLQGVLSALAVAHGQGIVHRDLKPDNVYLARSKDGSYTVKLLDFGIAKVMDAAGGMGKRTRTGMLLGTPAYMSPEQIRSTRDVDARSDLFSVGVLAFEMLTGKPAFPAPTEYAKLAAVLRYEPPLLEEIDPALGHLSQLVKRALAKDREQRFQSAAEMAQALAQATGGPRSVEGTLPELPHVPSLYHSVAPVSATPASQLPPVSAAQSMAGPPRTQSSVVPTTRPALEIPAGLLQSVTPEPRVVTLPHGANAVHKPTGTLPSHDLPMLEPGAPLVSVTMGRPLPPPAPTASNGRAVWTFVVVALLAAALLVGFWLGRL